jgi:hypothetical protein
VIEAVLDVVGNTLPGDMLGNVVLSSKLDLPWFDFNDEAKRRQYLHSWWRTVTD